MMVTKMNALPVCLAFAVLSTFGELPNRPEDLSSPLTAFGPGGMNPGGGGNQPDMPGGGGQQPGGGGQPSADGMFVYDTFLTDSTGVGIDVRNGMWISTDLTCASIVSNSNLVEMVVGAAAGSVALTNVDLRMSSSLTEIPSCAFSGCENLVSVTLPTSVTNIAADAFIGCPKLASVSYGGETGGPDVPDQPGEGGEGTEGGGETPPDQPGEGGEGGGETPPDQPGEGGEGGGETPPDKPGEGGEGGGETPPDKPGEGGEGGETVEPALTGVLLLDGMTNVVLNGGAAGATLSSTNSDENVILVRNGASLEISNYTLHKSGDCSNADNSNFFAVNAVVAAKSGATNAIDRSALYANADGANGLFASGDGSTIYAYDCSVTSTKSSSRGLDATFGGTVIASKMSIDTAGDHCAALATDRGNGYISVSESSLATAGQGSPLVYSTGIIEVNGVTGTATGAQIAGIEGLSAIRIKNSDLSGSGKKASEPVANGVIIYQSMSGDSTEGTASFEVSDSALRSAISGGALFYVTNTRGDITVRNTVLDFDSVSNCLVKAAGNDGSNGWGKAGANGAEVVFTALDQKMSGNVSVDGISSLDLYLVNSEYTGAVVQDTASAGNGGVDLFVCTGSTWTVTASCTLQNLTVAPGAKIRDEGERTVSIVHTNGTVLATGTSDLTITVSGYAQESVAAPHAIADFEIDRSAFEAKYASSLPDEPIEPESEPQGITFESERIEATEGEALTVRVKGGCTNAAASVKLCLAYQTASSSDLNLTKGAVDGVATKLTFPLVLTWEAGEVSTREISIPVKTDSSKEVDEQLTFQLASATGCDLGKAPACTVVLHDAKGSSASALPLAYALAEPADAGRVTGTTRKAAGKSVTLSATANSGYVFSGWYRDATNTSVSACLSQNPKYTFVMGTEDVALHAKFIAKSADVAAIAVVLPDEMTNGVTAVNAPVDVSGCTSLPTVKVTGLPTGLKFTAKDVVDSKTKTVTASANSIYGTPTRSGIYTVVATVTTAGKKTASTSQTVVVRKAGESVVETDVALVNGAMESLETEAVVGKVSGRGVYAGGKTVTLSATATSGYVFIGWYDGETCLTQAAKLKFAVPGEDVRYTARFVTKDTDAAAISCTLDGSVLSAEESLSVSNTCGVRLSYPIAAAGLSAVTVTASGLPTGLKLVCNKTSGAYSVEGIPTVVSKANSRTGLVTPSTAKFTVTTSGKSKKAFVVLWTIGALPKSAVGTWNGIAGSVGEDESFSPAGNFTLTATATGAVSAKAVTGVGTASFSGKGWIEDEDGTVWQALTNRTYGILRVRLDPQADWTEDSLSADVTGGKFGDEVVEISAYRNPYGKTGTTVENADAQAALRTVVGTWPVNVNGPNGEALSGTAKILKTGQVTVSGKLANGKTSYTMSGVLEVRRSDEELIPAIRLVGVTKYGCVWSDESVVK